MFAEILFRYVGGEFDLTGWGLAFFVFLALVVGRWGRGGWGE